MGRRCPASVRQCLFDTWPSRAMVRYGPGWCSLLTEAQAWCFFCPTVAEQRLCNNIKLISISSAARAHMYTCMCKGSEAAMLFGWVLPRQSADRYSPTKSDVTLAFHSARSTPGRRQRLPSHLAFTFAARRCCFFPVDFPPLGRAARLSASALVLLYWSHLAPH